MKKKHKIPKVGMRIWKTVIAVFLSLLVGFFLDYTPLYTVITVILCIQANTDESVNIAGVRGIGTAIGGIFAEIFVVITSLFDVSQTSVIYYLLASLCIIPLIHINLTIHHKDSASLTCVVFFCAILNTSSNPYLYVLKRVFETFIGIIIALAVNLIIKNPDKTKSPPA